MKKVIFMALATVFMFSSGFGTVGEGIKLSNSHSSEITMPCDYSITTYYLDADDNMRSYTTFYRTTSESISDCREKAQWHADFLSYLTRKSIGL